jgi:hypothetical protein
MRILLATIISLILALPVSAAPGDIHYIGSKQAEVKTEPSEDSETKLVIALGRRVMEFGREGEWVNVGIDRTGGMDGWVRAEHLQPNEP